MYFLTLILIIPYLSCDSSSVGNYSSTRVPRSWGGDEASINEFPYTVNLNFKSSHKCGGTILSPYFVITAAHCFYNSKHPELYRVRAGSSYRNRGGSVHYVFNITLHPNSTASKDNPLNDLALLRLGNPIDIDNKTRRTVPMFGIGEEIGPRTDATIAGWGCIDKNEFIYSEQLRSLKMTIIDKNKCSDIYKNDVTLQQDEICASAPSNSNIIRGVCEGDSGGPLVIKDKLAGVVNPLVLLTIAKCGPTSSLQFPDIENGSMGLLITD